MGLRLFISAFMKMDCGLTPTDTYVFIHINYSFHHLPILLKDMARKVHCTEEEARDAFLRLKDRSLLHWVIIDDSQSEVIVSYKANPKYSWNKTGEWNATNDFIRNLLT